MSECSCGVCQHMCKWHPCTTTPDDVERLIEAGLIRRLAEDRFEIEVPVLDGHPELGIRWKTVRSILPAIKGSEFEQGPNPHQGECTFFSNGLCEIHDCGLKPTGGKKASCQKTMAGEGYAIHRGLIEQWDTDRGRALVQIFIKEICSMWD